MAQKDITDDVVYHDNKVAHSDNETLESKIEPIFFNPSLGSLAAF